MLQCSRKTLSVWLKNHSPDSSSSSSSSPSSLLLEFELPLSSALQAHFQYEATPKLGIRQPTGEMTLLRWLTQQMPMLAFTISRMSTHAEFTVALFRTSASNNFPWAKACRHGITQYGTVAHRWTRRHQNAALTPNRKSQIKSKIL